MSPNTANSLVHDLVEMAKAMDVLPQVEQERDNLKTEVDRLSQSVQDRELRIVDYKSKIDELLARVRATEAERDDAELRFLDLEEKSNKVLAKLSSITAAAHDAAMVIDPPKPQPEPIVEQPPMIPFNSPEASAELGKYFDEQPSIPEVNPTPTSTPQSMSGTNDGGEVAKLSGPYTNKYYIQVDGYISRYDWLAGGGTEESYDWRPAQSGGSSPL